MAVFLGIIDWGSALTDIISSLIVTLVTAVVGALFIQRYLTQITFSNKMKDQGFVNTSTNKQSQKEISRMCKKASEIKMIYVSGFHFLNMNEHHLRTALDRGAKVKVLCSHPDSVFLKDIENMEYHHRDTQGKRLRERDKKISTEVKGIIEKYQDSGLEIKFYSSEYRLPFILASYPDGSVKAWLTVTLPPYKSTKSFVLRGEKKGDQIYDDEINFIDMMETHFDVVWNHGSKTVEEVSEDLEKNPEKLQEDWKKAYDTAKQNMAEKKGNKGALIEIAAQHPLLDGDKPNEEFEKRLLEGTYLYHRLVTDGKDVKIYVPGSVHKDNGVVDKISLSEAGKRFLLQQGICESDIFADEMNVKYKGEDGVYNSTDECYVASRIFDDMNYGELHCVCSSAQMSRKVLSYIHYGYVPDVHTVSCNEMYHDYVNEIFDKIPNFLADKSKLNGDWDEAKELRRLRKPE